MGSKGHYMGGKEKWPVFKLSAEETPLHQQEERARQRQRFGHLIELLTVTLTQLIWNLLSSGHGQLWMHCLCSCISEPLTKRAGQERIAERWCLQPFWMLGPCNLRSPFCNQPHTQEGVVIIPTSQRWELSHCAQISFPRHTICGW